MKSNNNKHNHNIENAISHIDDDLLDSALLMRRQLQQNQPVKHPARALRRILAVAACLAVLGAAVAIAVIAAPAEPAETTETTESPVEVFLPDRDCWQDVNLDEIYEIEPGNLYFPRSGFENLTLEKCAYQSVENAEIYYSDILDPPVEYGDSLFATFQDHSKGLSEYLYITVHKTYVYPEGDWRNEPYTPYDTTDVDSYERARHELAYYIDGLDHYIDGKVVNERHNKAFLPQDITLEVIENLYHDYTLFESEFNHMQERLNAFGYTERYSFDIQIILDDGYTISYNYEGNNITPEMMYDMITSAEYFSD